MRQDLILQASPPKVGTLIRIVGEAETTSHEGSRPAVPAIQLQVVAPEELFYEILLRQRAERAKFIASSRRWRSRPRAGRQPSSEDFSG